jgi:hypothetical protein
VNNLTYKRLKHNTSPFDCIFPASIDFAPHECQQTQSGAPLFTDDQKRLPPCRAAVEEWLLADLEWETSTLSADFPNGAFMA